MSQKETFNSIVDTARDIMPRDAQVFLYGSQARGDANSNSDWDVLILLNQDSTGMEEFNKYCYPLFELGWKIGAEINPVIYTVKEWDRRKGKSLFHHNVTKDAIRLC